MPKSKRNKVVSLTQVRKKGMDFKKEIIDTVKQYVDEYKNIFIFSYQNLKTARFQKIREEWQFSKFYLAKNKLVSYAFGKSQEDEYKKNLHKVSLALKGSTGLLFTNEPEKKISRWFASFEDEDNMMLILEAMWSNDGTFKNFGSNV